MSKKKIYVDFSSTANINNKGSLELLEDIDAVENAFRLWISSFQGDFINQPNKGGYITQWLLKPLSDNNAESIRYAIQDGIEEDFTPAIVLTSVEVTPVYENNYYNIVVKGYIPSLKEKVSWSNKLKTMI